MMTGEGVTGCRDSNFVGLLAVHLVGQVIEEAYIIANATSESGQGYQDILPSYRSNRPIDIEAVDEIIVSKGNYYMNEVKTVNAVNIVATSTPQKLQGESEERDVSNFIGQGDEDTNLYKNELTKSTSMLLNHLFDMSDVEKIICDDPTSLVRDDSYLNNALGMTFAVEVNADNNTNDQISTSERSSFSLLADASKTKNEKVKLSKDTGDILGGSHASLITASVEQTAGDIGEKQNENVVDGYENTYLTLNRDYDQGSEDDVEVILQDPRVLSLHEIELITANTSDDDLRAPELKEEQNNLVATSTVAASENTSGKSTLARRFKIRGVKLLSCFKGWWYRKTPANNKENRTTILIQGPIQICPLSPNARRRAASSLDDRVHRAPSPSRPIVWKFNTIADPLTSSRWKDYTFDDKPENFEN